MIRRLVVPGEVKPFCGGAEAKASLNRAKKLVAIDAKPRELRMGRMKEG
jgi:CDGSH-type Zn-finger protein